MRMIYGKPPTDEDNIQPDPPVEDNEKDGVVVLIGILISTVVNIGIVILIWIASKFL